ncbi:MAG: methyltransferase domain-containing protein [Rhodanobacter sp.]
MVDIDSGLPMPVHVQWVAFFKQWLKNPLRMASVVPSGRQLAQMMVAAMPQDARHVVELGAGTGAITEALLRHGVAPTQLLAIEMNATLHDLLLRRFPETHVLCADARHLSELVERSGAFASGRADVVLSSLGLLAMPAELQREILAAAFAVLRPGGVFVQYTYGMRSPLDDGVREQLGLRCTRFGQAWRNLPPARVFVYSRD